MSKLLDLLGGNAAVEAVVETFYRHVLKDERISHFFDDVDMDRQMNKQKTFLTMAFGSPVQYSGQDMRRAHIKLVERGLNDDHFDAVKELLAQSLSEHAVAKSHIQDVSRIAESVRAKVLCR